MKRNNIYMRIHKDLFNIIAIRKQKTVIKKV